MTYIALLRGINVGGNNIIKMADLRACFAEAGYENVRTYIQSGNVLFETKRTASTKLEVAIETMLKKRFGYDGVVVVIVKAEIEAVVAEAPKGFGTEPDQFRYDVMFLKHPLKIAQASKDIPVRARVDTKYAGKHAVYFTRAIKDAGKGYFSKITGLPVYQQMTIRNWNTTTKLLTLAQS